ncbi:MAG: L-2-amino-thiazoline-4-carboxylic acid hydrolase [Candidatus Thorarchaeota archaeon]
MKFVELGSYNMEALEDLAEIQPLEFAEKYLLLRLDYILGFIKKIFPENYDLFVRNLEKNYSESKAVDYVRNKKFDITKTIARFKNLNKHKQLAVKSLDYFLGLLELDPQANWEKEKLKATKRNNLRAYLIPSYQNFVSLSDTIGREDAIKLAKQFITEYTIFSNKDIKTKYSTLDELWEDDIKDFENNGNPGWIRIEGNVENGRLVNRRDTCLWAEAIKDLPDSYFRYLAACYGDFQGAQVYWNKHFILTMKHTIAKGDPYCSCVVHDTRIDWDLTHPDEEFWESISPLKEWQKKKEMK